MSDIAARVSLHQDLTTNSVIEALKKRQARSPAAQPGEVSPSLAPYRAAAAVLHVFDPARLNPLSGGPAGAPPEIGLISAAAVGYINRLLRSLSIEQRNAANPVPLNAEVLKEGRAHFADHCAICHGNDGSGQTPIGKNVYPKSPDLRLADTQSLSDGELFWVIHNGIRFTAMPAWGSGEPEKDLDSW